MDQTNGETAMLEIIGAYDKLLIVVNKHIISYKVYPKILTDRGNKKFHPLLNRCLYMALVQSDLVVGLKYLAISSTVDNQIEANYFARVVALGSYEALDKYSTLVGKNIQIDSTKPDFIKALNEVNEVGKKFNTLKKSCFKHLGEIRNKVIAHKDADSLKQTDIMLKIEDKYIYSIGTQLMEFNFELLKGYNELIDSL